VDGIENDRDGETTVKAYQRLVASTKEALQTEVFSKLDPTATAPDWAVVPADEDEPVTGSAEWVAGSWDPAGWTERTGLASPISAFVGDGQAHPLVRGSTYKVFVRWHDGSGLPVKFLGLLVAD
jgi:hypothetical protein